MNPSDMRICLDVQAPHGAVELDAKQGDSQRRIFITLTDGGIPYRITEDCIPVFTAKKPDGTVLYNRCFVENNAAVYPLTRQTTACPGRVRCELRLYSGALQLDEQDKPVAGTDQLLTAAAFTLHVHPQVCSDTDLLTSQSESTWVEQLVSDTHTLITQVQTKLDSGEFVGAQGPQGEKGDKGDPGEVNIDDENISEDATWSSDRISAEIMDCVGYYLQNKTNDEKAQARENIGAIADGDYVTELTADFLGVADSDDPADPGSKRAAYMRYWGCRGDGTDNIRLIGTESETGDVAISGVAPGMEDADAVNKKQLDEAELAVIDKLCPSFTESGAVVTCQPVEGYPLTVTAEDGATITRCGKNLIDPVAYMKSSDPVDTSLEGDVFTSNFQNGALYINEYTDRKITLPRGTYTATFLPVTEGAVCNFFIYSAATDAQIAVAYSISAANPSFTFTAEEDFRFAVAGSRPYGMQSYRLQLEAGSKSTGYEPYQGSTFAAGQQIPALSGVNTLYANTGEITVSGRADLAAKLERLEQAILAQGANV